MEDELIKYELMLLFRPDLPEKEQTQEIESIKNLIQSLKGEITYEEPWGMQELFYAIKKQKNGFYVILNFYLDPSQIKELDDQLKLLPALMRHLLIKVAADYQPQKYEEEEEGEEKTSQDKRSTERVKSPEKTEPKSPLVVSEKPVKEPEPVEKPEPPAKPEPEPEAEPVEKPAEEPEAEPVKAPEPAKEPEPPAESEPEAKAEPEAEPVEKPAEEPEAEPVKAPEPAKEPEPPAEPESAPEVEELVKDETPTPSSKTEQERLDELDEKLKKILDDSDLTL